MAKNDNHKYPPFCGDNFAIVPFVDKQKIIDKIQTVFVTIIFYALVSLCLKTKKTVDKEIRNCI
jgi:hypothetical protein